MKMISKIVSVHRWQFTVHR